MADAPKINPTDTLRESYPKLNQAIVNANNAINTANSAKATADEAKNTANNVQAQFNQVVIEGDSSVEAAQARVSYTGTTYTTLKERLDQEHESVSTQLADNMNKIGILSGSSGVSVELYRTALDADDSACIRAAINDLVLTKNLDHVTLKLEAKTYVCKSGITIYASRMSLVAERGATLDFSELTSGTAIKIDGLDTDTTNAPLRELKGIRITGNNVSGVIGVEITSATKYANGFSFEDVAIDKFDTCLKIYSNAWCNSFRNVTFNSPNGVCVYIPVGGTNYGERITFISCTFYNSKECIKLENGAADIQLIGCSLDYSNRMISIKGGRIYATNCHFETGNSQADQDYLFYVQGDGGYLSIKNSDIHVYGTRVNYPVGYCSQDSGTEVNWGGISLEDVWINVSGNERNVLIEGTGRVFANRIFSYYGGINVPISKNLSPLRFGGLNAISDLTNDGWVSDGVLPDIDTTVKKEGAGAARFQPSTDNQRRHMKIIVPLSAWQKPLISFWLKTSGIQGTGKNFTFVVKYLDKNNALVNEMQVNYNTDMDWTSQKFQPTVIPGKQVTQMMIIFDTGSNWITSMSAWIDDFIVNTI